MNNILEKFKYKLYQNYNYINFSSELLFLCFIIGLYIHG